jgi:hypothetical protein
MDFMGRGTNIGKIPFQQKQVIYPAIVFKHGLPQKLIPYAGTDVPVDDRNNKLFIKQ